MFQTATLAYAELPFYFGEMFVQHFHDHLCHFYPTPTCSNMFSVNFHPLECFTESKKWSYKAKLTSFDQLYAWLKFMRMTNSIVLFFFTISKSNTPFLSYRFRFFLCTHAKKNYYIKIDARIFNWIVLLVAPDEIVTSQRNFCWHFFNTNYLSFGSLIEKSVKIYISH